MYEAFLHRNARSVYSQADETRWLVFVEQDGKTGYRWWLWAYLGEDTVAFRIAPSRGHEVPERHYPSDAKGFLVVDRYSAYKAMVQVKLGNLRLVFCWAHVRRDFLAVGKGWPELTPWAILWLQRIRELYRLNRQRLQHDATTAEFQRADATLREAATTMHSEAASELADAKLRSPCRKTLGKPDRTLAGPDPFRGRSKTSDGQQRFRTRHPRSSNGAKKTTMARVHYGAFV